MSWYDKAPSKQDTKPRSQKDKDILNNIKKYRTARKHFKWF